MRRREYEKIRYAMQCLLNGDPMCCDYDPSIDQIGTIESILDRAEQILAEGELCPMTRKIFEKWPSFKSDMESKKLVPDFDSIVREAFVEMIPTIKEVGKIWGIYSDFDANLSKVLDKIRNQEPLS